MLQPLILTDYPTADINKWICLLCVINDQHMKDITMLRVMSQHFLYLKLHNALV
jgi:hypothetical protein